MLSFIACIALGCIVRAKKTYTIKVNQMRDNIRKNGTVVGTRKRTPLK